MVFSAKFSRCTKYGNSWGMGVLDHRAMVRRHSLHDISGLVRGELAIGRVCPPCTGSLGIGSIRAI